MAVGRPKSDNPKTITVGIRLTPEEVNKLDFVCTKMKKSRRDFVVEYVNQMHESLILRSRIPKLLESKAFLEIIEESDTPKIIRAKKRYSKPKLPTTKSGIIIAPDNYRFKQPKI